MRRFLSLVLLLPALAAGRPLCVPYRWTENFQRPNLGHFASYPPVQDMGYDPSISPAKRFGAPGRGCLMRVVRPPLTGPERSGFIRWLQFLSSAGARLSFSYRLDHARPEDRVEIGLAGSGGQRYTGTAAIEPGRWHTVALPLSAFKDRAGRNAAAGTAMDGLYLLADLKRADADIAYRLLIHDLELLAEREAGFDIRAPRSVPIAHWRTLFSTAVIDAGQPVPVEAKPPVSLARVECAVVDQTARRFAPNRFATATACGQCVRGCGPRECARRVHARAARDRGGRSQRLHGGARSVPGSGAKPFIRGSTSGPRIAKRCLPAPGNHGTPGFGADWNRKRRPPAIPAI